MENNSWWQVILVELTVMHAKLKNVSDLLAYCFYLYLISQVEEPLSSHAHGFCTSPFYSNPRLHPLIIYFPHAPTWLCLSHLFAAGSGLAQTRGISAGAGVLGYEWWHVQIGIVSQAISWSRNELWARKESMQPWEGSAGSRLMNSSEKQGNFSEFW